MIGLYRLESVAVDRKKLVGRECSRKQKNGIHLSSQKTVKVSGDEGVVIRNVLEVGN